MNRTLAAVVFALVVVSSGAAFQEARRISGVIGGYQPVSDVDQHARMSADVCAINALLDTRPIDFAAIDAIYRRGQHSVESNGSMRTLGTFARGARSSEYVLGRYERQWGAGWLDVFASAAIGGTGAFAGEPDLVRRQGIQKAVRDQVLVAWAFHELDAAVEKANKGEFDAHTGAPHNWDEARAYYHGEQPACAAFATAEERDREFGTSVSAKILAAMKQGLQALQARDASGAITARGEVVRNITTTYMQSALKYSAVMTSALASGKKDDARVFQAEGWAYYRVIEPLIAGRDAMASQTVARVFNLENAPAPDAGETVSRAFSTVYAPLGIHVSEIGTYRAPH